MTFKAEEIDVLDRIIRTRRSVKKFTKEIPPKNMIEDILEAGRLAPYAGLPNRGTVDFRRFFVLSQDSDKIEQLESIVIKSVVKKQKQYEQIDNPRLDAMRGATEHILQHGSPIGSAPWIVIVGERGGYPAREDQALAYCMQNMWLKATTLSLGIRLLSSVSDIKDDPALSEMFGLVPGEFAFDACMIGYPKTPLSDSVREEPHLSVSWL